MKCESCKYANGDVYECCGARCEDCKYSEYSIDDEPCMNCCENDCRFEKR